MTEHRSAFPRVTVIGPAVDGSGLNVCVALGTLAEARRRGVDVVTALGARVPVTIEREDEPSRSARSGQPAREIGRSLDTEGDRSLT